MSLRILVITGVFCLACGSSGQSNAPGAGGSAGASGSAGAAGQAGAGASGGSAGASPKALNIVLGSSIASYPHQDQLASQTAFNVQAGVRSLALIDDQGDSWTLFEAGADAKPVSYDDGAATNLATLSASQLRPGHYVRARLVQDWSRLTVDATRHELTQKTPGSLEILQITSDGTKVGGKTYAAGDFEHTFTAAGGAESFSGNAPIPATSMTAEAEAIIENGAWAVYFPMDLTVTPSSLGTLTVTANMHRAFRWTDTSALGYTTEIYDIAPPLYEWVRQFGANRFDVQLQAP